MPGMRSASAVGGAQKRLELEALAQEVEALVALGRAELGLHRLGEDAGHHGAGVELQVLRRPGPSGWRGCRSSGAARASPCSPPRARRPWRRRAPRWLRRPLKGSTTWPDDAAHARLPSRMHLLHLHGGQHARAGAHRGRHVGDVHRLLGAAAAAGEALAAARGSRARCAGSARDEMPSASQPSRKSRLRRPCTFSGVGAMPRNASTASKCGSRSLPRGARELEAARTTRRTRSPAGARRWPSSRASRRRGRSPACVGIT